MHENASRPSLTQHSKQWDLRWFPASFYRITLEKPQDARKDCVPSESCTEKTSCSEKSVPNFFCLCLGNEIFAEQNEVEDVAKIPLPSQHFVPYTHFLSTIHKIFYTTNSFNSHISSTKSCYWAQSCHASEHKLKPERALYLSDGIL